MTQHILRTYSFVIAVWSLSLTACVGPGFGTAKEPMTPQEQVAAALNSWIGKSKDDRIKHVGLPAGCMMLSSGEEACEWVRQRLSGGSFSYSDTYGGVGMGSLNSEEHRVTFTYDREHVARFWSYHGNLGAFTSRPPTAPKESGQ